MAETINKAEAEKILLAAFRERCSKHDTISESILSVLSGSHKTYKYILVNGLLAKATNEHVNSLSLQAGAPIEGAFDARSLCHDVLVPFERDFLSNALGGSNEPFLNKPARFTHLSIDNAVRKGKDKILLESLIYIFNSIFNSSDAKAYLSCSLAYLSQKIEEIRKLQDSTIKYNPTLVEIYEFSIRFLEKSFEGETCAILIATLEKIYHNRFSKNFKVIAHKINQSGSSSKEVGDIDVYKLDSFYYAIEIKDKKFTEYDLEHAFSKIRKAGGKKGQFIYGPNGTFNERNVLNKISEFEKDGFMVLFNDIFIYSKMMIFKIDLNSKQEFIDTLINSAIEINSKEETLAWIQNLLESLNWK